MSTNDWQTTSMLLVRLGRFDQETVWGEFAGHFREPLVRFARRTGLTDADAQDASQEVLMTFARLYREGKYDRSRGRLRAWLFGIARKVCAGMHRQVGRHAGQESPVPSSADLDAPALEAWRELWDQEWVREVHARALHAVAREVDSQTLVIFRALVFAEESAESIALRLGIQRTTVYNAKYRVARRLRELVREYEGA